PNVKWATVDIPGEATFDDSTNPWISGKWRFPTRMEWINLIAYCSQSYNSATKTLTLKYGDKTLTFENVEEGTIYWTGDEPYEYTTYIPGSGDNGYVTKYLPYYVKFENGKFSSPKYDYNVTSTNTNGRVRLVATIGKVVISDVPDGWTVNGMYPTDGKVSVEMGSKLTVVPGMIPAGKKIKSIRLDPVTE
ncbi:MAG: hypothetical protein IJM78_03345, partial [Prevotella sp.]|nr:hypothetical protein [Prevotella sp.]